MSWRYLKMYLGKWKFALGFQLAGVACCVPLAFGAALGRSQSTPGLVESEGRTTLEDMWLSPISPFISHQPRTGMEVSQSILSLGHSNTQSTQSSDDPQNGFKDTAKPNRRSHNGNDTGQENLEDELNVLRSRLYTIETENQILNSRLCKQEWNLEKRLAEIELQIRGQSSISSLDQENETDEVDYNQESII